MAKIYPDRFDPEYLSELAAQLDIERLKASALPEEKKIGDVTYTKCISIDFCGLAATTLLYPSLDRDQVNEATIGKRKAILTAFEGLFAKDVLNGLNTDGYYLRVRFCFAYLYSDFPICLMKAEQSASWNYMEDIPIRDYYINKPLSSAEFWNSDIRWSQEHSLREIIRVISDNPDIVIVEGQEQRVNSIQVRFCTIPASICVLLINDTACYDLYLYAKSEGHEQLSLLSPVVIVREDDAYSPQAFTTFRKHFQYLWRNDLTLFCSDATGFTPDNIAGLSKLLAPDRVIGPTGTNWTQKESRIWAKKEREAGHPLEKTQQDTRHIIEWKANLNKKLSACTRMIANEKIASGSNQIFITVGAVRKFYYFKIECKDRDIVFESLDRNAFLIYCVMVHYCYARLHPWNKPVLHTYYREFGKNYGKLKKRITEQLNNCDLDQRTNSKSQWGSGNDCFDSLFNLSSFQLIVPPENIDFDYSAIEVIKTAKYHPRDLQAAISCLDYRDSAGSSRNR